MRSLKFLPKLKRLKKPFFLRQVHGCSMLPRLRQGQIVAATGWFGRLHRNDIVIIEHEGLEKIKRVKRTRPGSVYLRGDNASKSSDSRQFGWLSTELVRGKVIWPQVFTRASIFRLVGFLGTFGLIIYFVMHPTWPTSDKILFFLTFVFMAFGQAWKFLKRFVPFVLILLTYESFRGLVPGLNGHINYLFMANFDKWLTHGALPTVTLQHWLWHGHVQWYDFIFYGVYMLHFVLPMVLAIMMWKWRPGAYWRVIAVYGVVSYAGFLTYWLFPAAPPWMASNFGLITHVQHISDPVFSAMGIQNSPSIYNHISPNPVAAVPSLHAAYATLFAYSVWRYFGRRLGLVACLQPMLIYFGTIYMAEHYLFDEILGILYAFGSVIIVNLWIKYPWPVLRKRFDLFRKSLPEQSPLVDN